MLGMSFSAIPIFHCSCVLLEMEFEPVHKPTIHMHSLLRSVSWHLARLPIFSLADCLFVSIFRGEWCWGLVATKQVPSRWKPERSPDREVEPKSCLVGRGRWPAPACSRGRNWGGRTTHNLSRQGSPICSVRCCPGAGNLLSWRGTFRTCIF